MRRLRSTLFVIALNNVLMVLGFRLWQSLFQNFAIEELGVEAGVMGWIQALREVPGLLGFSVVALALVLTEMRVAGLSVVLMGFGIFLTGFSQEMPGLLVATVLMSIGFHFFYSSNSSAVLITVGHDEAPKMLGRLNSLGAVAALLATFLVFGTLETWGYRRLFQVAGAVVTVAGLVLLPFGRQAVPIERKRGRPPLRKRYWLYYLLQFFMGSRRHIFTTFAVFLLVDRYQVTAQIITLLFLINNLIGTYFHQAFGKIVARYGERRVLTFNFVVLTFVFLGYAIIPQLKGLAAGAFLVPAIRFGEWVLVPPFDATPALFILLGLFVVDHILFGFSIAVECYLQKISVAPEEITPNVSLGQTINHIAAVVLPVAGGIVWQALGGQYTFLIGVGIALVSLALTQWIRTPQPVLAEAPVGCR